MKTLYPYILVSVIFFQSCSNNTLDDISENLIDIPPEIVTYQNIQPIVSQNCIVCHSNPPQNGAPMSLETYLDVKNAVLNRGLLHLISLPEGNTALMPKGGPRLPQASINLFIQWEEDNLLEN